MASIFTRIVRGELPAHKVAEDDQHLAFLDIQPLVLGHTLVVPKRELDYYFDLDDSELAELNVFAKGVAATIQRVVPCVRVGVAVIGLEVPHVHLHLVPLNTMDDINFGRAKLSPSREELGKLAQKLRLAYV